MKRSPIRSLHMPALYAASAARTVRTYGFAPARAVGGLDDAPVFVVGSPRSGTSFMAESLGRVPGFADLGEFNPLKRHVADLLDVPRAEAARRIGRMLRMGQRLGMVSGLTAVEQTPETTFLIPQVATAFPQARFIHMVRDGRDVVCSLLERAWLDNDAHTAHDDAGNDTGPYARFWVEPERRDEFVAASSARRAAWAWRQYEQAAQAGLTGLEHRTLTVRYEEMGRDPQGVAQLLAGFLHRNDAGDAFEREYGAAHARSVERWRQQLSDEQQSDVLAEAGELLEQLGYVTEPTRP